MGKYTIYSAVIRELLVYRRRVPNLSTGLREVFPEDMTSEQRPEEQVIVAERAFWAVAEVEAKAYGQEMSWAFRQLYMDGKKVQDGSG